MFDDTIVVQSAVSAFNNAALSAPAFLWYGILAVPLFIMVCFCGNSFLNKLGWTRDNIVKKSSLAVVVMTFMWMILMGGNYVVLRDQISVLPYVIAMIMFGCSFFVTSYFRDVKLPSWRKSSRRMRLIMLGIGALLFGALAVSDMHAWWGPLLQICAFLFGFVLGRRVKGAVPAMPGASAIMMMCVIAILMQPEFFRFGQLGNLTILHLLGLMVFGIAVVGATVLNNIVPANRIHHSAYVKLKWLVRFVVLLGFALFVLTESVPVFAGVLCAVAVQIAMSVWHARRVSGGLAVRFWAIALCAFGVITTMPAITALGILCWTSLPRADFWAESRFLL